jgi:hypothetical protein
MHVPRRGKKKQKHYTVFICEITAEDKATFKPKLNNEHREYRWWPMHALPVPTQLHPVVVSRCSLPQHGTIDNSLCSPNPYPCWYSARIPGIIGHSGHCLRSIAWKRLPWDLHAGNDARQHPLHC